jgi:addiction module RelE/StbE family toxin
MAYEVTWSPEAIEDLESIATYIGRNSPNYATAVVEKMLNTAAGLSHFPFAGRMVPELDDEAIREKLVYNYRLIYRVQDEDVTIIAVIHGKRQLPFDVG